MPRTLEPIPGAGPLSPINGCRFLPGLGWVLGLAIRRTLRVELSHAPELLQKTDKSLAEQEPRRCRVPQAFTAASTSANLC